MLVKGTLEGLFATNAKTLSWMCSSESHSTRQQFAFFIEHSLVFIPSEAEINITFYLPNIATKSNYLFTATLGIIAIVLLRVNRYVQQKTNRFIPTMCICVLLMLHACVGCVAVSPWYPGFV